MRRKEVTKNDIINNLQYLKAHIIENEQRTLNRASIKLNLNINDIIEKFTGYHYDYNLVNGHNLQFIAKNTLDKSIFRALNYKHYEALEQKINEEMNRWIDIQENISVAA